MGKKKNHQILSPHFTAEEIEALRRKLTSPRSQTWKEAELGVQLGLLTSEPSLHHWALMPRTTAVCVSLFCHMSQFAVILCLHVKVLAYLPVNSLWSGAHLFLCPPCCYTGNIMILWRYTERAMNLPRPHSTVLPKAETKGWESRGKEGGPASPCHCCSPTATPLPAKLPESDSHRATWSLHKGGSPFSPVPGPPQPCICWGLVKGLPTWLKNIFNINLNQNYTTMMDLHSKVFCHEFYGADLIFYVALLLYFQFFSILIILKWFWLPSVVFHINIYPPSALYLDHILANYCICHCEFKGGFYSDQIQFSQSHFSSWVLSRFASPCSWCLPILGFSHC